MKSRLTGTILLILLAGLALAAIVRQTAINRLTRENASLRAEAREVTRLAAENQNLPQLRSEHEEVARLRRENENLPALRNEVRQLRRQTEDLAKLRAENQRLSTAAANVSGPPQVKARPEGFIDVAAMTDVGLATPEAAIQTLFWALIHRNARRLMDCIQAPQNAGPWWNENYVLENATSHFPKGFPGFRIAEQKANSPDEVTVGLQSSVDGAIAQFNVRRVGNEWKLAGL